MKTSWKTRFAGAAAVVALGMSIVLPAVAAEPSTGSPASPDEWDFAGWYGSHDDCARAGADDVRHGGGITYACTPDVNGGGLWALWLQN